MALAVLVAAGLYLLLPADFRISPVAHVAYPVMLLTLLAVLIIGDPGRIDRDTRWLRVSTGVMIAVMTLGAAGAAVRLVVGILQKADFTSPGQLLVIGAVVWVSNVIAFALWYWHLDRGGPTARASRSEAVPPAFRFPEEDLEPLMARGWYPQFVDYLALSFNTGTAFGPTDVAAIRHWSKLWIMTESAISLALIGLVVARAVNIL